MTDAREPCAEPLSGFKEVQPMVFSGVFPVDSKDYQDLKDALEKLKLNDASFQFEPETSAALGFGFRCGFLGMLHMEITQERLEREYNLSLISTAPTVVYHVTTKSGEELRIDNPAELPPTQDIAAINEPRIITSIHVPEEYVGAVMKLCEERRGRQMDSPMGHSTGSWFSTTCHCLRSCLTFMTVSRALPEATLLAITSLESMKPPI